MKVQETRRSSGLASQRDHLRPFDETSKVLRGRNEKKDQYRVYKADTIRNDNRIGGEDPRERYSGHESKNTREKK